MSVTDAKSELPDRHSAVFISYQRRDQARAVELHQSLLAAGVEAWFDAGLREGQDWREELAARITSSRIFVILLSANANGSKEMKKELAVAASGEAALIPVRIDNAIPRGQFAYELMGRNWVNAFPEPRPVFDKLARQLKIALDGKGAVAVDRLAVRNASPFLDLVFWTMGLRWWVLAYLISVIALFVSWDRYVGITDQLIAGGQTPFDAYATAFGAAAFGAPWFVVQGLTGEIDAWILSITAFAFATCLFMLMIAVQLVRLLLAVVVRTVSIAYRRRR